MQDTIVWDPFYTELPQFFDMDFKEVLKEKDPLAWPEFEKGMIAEEELYERFFRDRRSIDGLGLAQHMVRKQNYHQLVSQGSVLHACMHSTTERPQLEGV